jgi:hypothetical protein
MTTPARGTGLDVDEANPFAASDTHRQETDHAQEPARHPEEYLLPEGMTIVSCTDLKGRITYVNDRLPRPRRL